MKIIKELADQHEELTRWRHDLHAHPELAFEETRTADFVAKELQSAGFEVVRGVGGTGIVASLRVGASKKCIGIRADMDALPMDELNEFAHKSRHPGKMHGCGHDGHTVMALAAARHLAASRNFNGTIRFFFQPAEEANDNGSGADAMIRDGLFERFDVDAVFALHNAPGLKTGSIATRKGVITASMDLFEVTITGKGTHGAAPQSGRDPVLVASHMLQAWQSIISRNVNPQESAVLSATSITTGDAYTVIPQQARIRGSVRTLERQVQKLVKQRFFTLSEQLAAAFEVEVEISWRAQYPMTCNDPEQTELGLSIAADLVGEDNLVRDIPSVMGSEDFAFMLEKKPGCYFLLGNSDPHTETGETQDQQSMFGGDGAGRILVPGACMVHDPHYDFNDKILPLGASLWVRLAEGMLQ